MEIVYQISGNKYQTTRGYLTKIDSFIIEYISKINEESFGNHKVWVWDEKNNCISCLDEEGKVFYSLKEAIEFAVDYVQNKGKYILFYNIYDHDVNYEFINLKAEGGMNLFYKWFNHTVKLYYTEETNTEGIYNAVLMLNPCTALEHYREYKVKYCKFKSFSIQNTENIIYLVENKIPFYVVGNVNAESGKMEYNIFTDLKEVERKEDTLIFKIDEARID